MNLQHLLSARRFRLACCKAATGPRSCGHLTKPQDCRGDGDDCEVILGGLLEAGGDAAEVLELAEATFDEMPLSVKMGVERVLEGSRRIVRDDGRGALLCDGLPNVIGVVGGVSDNKLGRSAIEQRASLRGIAGLASREDEADWASEPSDGEMNFCGQAAARTADGLILSPPFAPLACWWARTMVESMIRYSKSGSSDIAAKMRCQTPLRLQRLKRRNTEFHSPNASGRSRQGEPVRTIHRTPSTNMRLLRPVEPRWSGRPMISPEILPHCSSLKTNRSMIPKAASQKTALNHASTDLRIPRVHRT